MARTRKARIADTPKDRISLMRQVSDQRRDSAEEGHKTPNWRRIEALRERRALLEALREPGMDEPELDETIFFPAPEQARAFYAASTIVVDEIEIDDGLDETEDLD